MENHTIVSQEEWVRARTAFLAKEKEFTRLREELNQQRRALPWVKVNQPYTFDGPKGKETLADLFDGRSQLLVYHFMFHPSWTDGCKSCSFWADNFNNAIVHLNQRDVTMIAISRAPLPQLEAFKQRMGWTFKWVSSFRNDFNFDYHVSFTPEELKDGKAYYNYSQGQAHGEESPGLSVFYKDARGTVFHTYSCYARGLDMLNGAYHHLDLVPKGRDEEGLTFPQAWVRHHDKYDS